MTGGPRHPARAATAYVLRRLPRSFRGRDRLMRQIGDRVPTTTPTVIAPMRLGYRMMVDLRSRTEVFAFYTGDYDTDLIAAALRLVPAGGVAVDVGGNVGFWAVPLARRAQVHAFEPVPSNAARIRDNAALNDVRRTLTVHEVALSDAPAQLTLSLREDFQRGAGTGNAAVVIDASDDVFASIEVVADTLDHQVARLGLTRLDVMKVDIEGHEDLALEGARETLRTLRPTLFVEWNVDYYRRRGVDATERFEAALEGLDYAYLRRGPSGWVRVDGFSSPEPIDDLVLVPSSRVPETLAVLTDALATVPTRISSSDRSGQDVDSHTTKILRVMSGTTRIKRRMRTHWIARIGGTDTSRWSRDQSFQQDWAERHALMGSGIRPGDAVVDLGSGPRSLERHLPEGCLYLPVDVVPRGEGSVVCDLNREEMPELAGDFVVMSGVLEYLHDVPQVLAAAAEVADRGVASYATTERFPAVLDRRGHGWVNDYDHDQIRAAIDHAGWSIVEEQEWAGQCIFHLRTKSGSR